MKINVFSFLKKYRMHMIVGPTFKMIEAVIELFIPILMANILDIGIANNDPKYIIRIGLLIFGLVILSFFTTAICQKVAAIAAQGFGTDLRNSLFKKISSLPLEKIDEYTPSSLSTRLSNDVLLLQEAVARLIRIVLRAPFLVIGSIIMAMTIDMKLSIIFLIITPIITIIFYFVIKKTAPLFMKIQIMLDNIALKVKEKLFGIRVIKSFNKEKETEKEFSKLNTEYAQKIRRANNVSIILNPSMTIIINIALMVILYFGANAVFEGRILTGKLIAFSEYLLQIQMSLIIVVNITLSFSKAAVAKKRVEEILNTQNKMQYGEQVDFREGENVIHFVDVSFNYLDGKENVLHHINLNIRKGEKIGIIGGTGSGKSTLAYLMMRMYEADEGNIKLGNQNIRDYSKDGINKNLTLILQKSLLFNGTILSNMKMANQDADEEEINKALEIAQIKKFTDINGFNYLIKEEGKNLSGGQKQRLNIARGLLKKSEIMIFDDVFSALDFKTEANLKKAIFKNYKDKTFIIISQRCSTLKNLDRIIVMDKGCIVGVGSHKELMNSCLLYQEIYESQSKVVSA